jgi:thioredoxin-like negative regulator of GroEL
LLERAATADPAARDEIRRVMVAVFEALGQDHPLSTSYRRRLAATLY